MSTPRPVLTAAAALFAATLSVDPSTRSASPPPRPPVSAPAASPDAPALRASPATPRIEALADPAPRDVEVEVVPDERGGHRVRVRRRGYLVSLRNETARAAGQDWALVRVTAQPGEGATAGRLVWETTRPDSLETTRGVVLLSGDGERLSAELRAARAPEPAEAWASQRARCAAQHDGLGGFTVLCGFAKGVRVTGVANVTGAYSLDDVWLVPGPIPVVRLDLPGSPDGAEGRVIGLVQGVTGVALRVEASFPEGEAASLLFGESERVQPTL